MFGALLYKIRAWRYAMRFSRWWINLRFYWYSHERGGLIFFLIASLVIGTLGFAVYYSVSETTHNQALTCLALNIYHEARGEPMAGQYAVAEVTMNRVASKRYPDTVCEVVYQQNWDRLRGRYVGAFSWTELESKARLNKKAWRRASQAAEAVYYGRAAPTVSGALFYHAKYIKPSWAKRKKPVARIGKHIFYR